MKGFRILRVWYDVRTLVLVVDRLSASIPNHRLAAHLRRSAAAVAANLAEGCEAVAEAEEVRFAHRALRAAGETRAHLLEARDLGLLGEAAFRKTDVQAERVEAHLAGVCRRLQPEARP